MKVLDPPQKFCILKVEVENFASDKLWVDIYFVAEKENNRNYLPIPVERLKKNLDEEIYKKGPFQELRSYDPPLYKFQGTLGQNPVTKNAVDELKRLAKKDKNDFNDSMYFADLLGLFRIMWNN